jgi:hypothetical protein
LKKELKGLYFDTMEIIEAEMQALLNTLIKHDFLGTFKSGRSSGNCIYPRKGTTSRRWCPEGQKLVFDRMAAPVPEIMAGSLYLDYFHLVAM